jgi:hypothetical protein
LAGAGRLPLIVYCGENLCYYIVISNSNNSGMVETSTVTFLFYLNHFSIIESYIVAILSITSNFF